VLGFGHNQQLLDGKQPPGRHLHGGGRGGRWGSLPTPSDHLVDAQKEAAARNGFTPPVTAATRPAAERHRTTRQSREKNAERADACAIDPASRHDHGTQMNVTPT